MSLVDYASSDEEETAAELVQHPLQKQHQQVIDEEEKRHRSQPSPVPLPSPNVNPPTPTNPQNKSSGSSTVKRREDFSNQPQPANLRLPDASFLLNSPAMPSHLLHASDHSSRVAAAMAESASRKRDLTGPSSSFPRSKLPKGTLPHSKSGPDTARGLLLPPQLTGRSNVVTEDISKLFVKKRVDSSP